jgi:hypothetical protein
MVKFANSLDNVAQWIAKHPNLTQGLVIGFGALAVSMSVIGKVMMTAAFIKFLGIGPAIATAAGGLGLLAAGIAAITAAVASASWLQHHYHWDEKIGGWLSDTINGAYNPNAKPSSGRSVYTGKGGISVHHTQINMDGRKVAEAVSSHQARGISRPLGGANHDGTLTLPTVVMSHAH